MEYTDKQREWIDCIEIKCKDWMNLTVLDFIEGKFLIVDGEGYKYLSSINVVKNARKRGTELNRFFRKNPYTYENILNYLKINNRDITLISTKLSNAKEDLSWFCPEHNYFQSSWNSIKNGSGCPVCGRILAASKNRNSYEYVRQTFENYGHILVSNIYINNLELLEFVCRKHKNKGIQKTSFGNLISKENICTFCNKEKHREKQMKTQEEFKNDLYKVHGGLYKVKGRYQGANNHMEFVCNTCGNEWSTKPTHLLSGHGCPKCASSSLGEDKIREILHKSNVSFKEEFRISECRYKKPLPFDFAIFDSDENLKRLIEYDGKQHFKPFGFGEKCEITVSREFEKIKLRDRIKDQYCKDNDIPLLRVPYWEFDNIENILTDNLRDLN